MKLDEHVENRGPKRDTRVNTRVLTNYNVIFSNLSTNTRFNRTLTLLLRNTYRACGMSFTRIFRIIVNFFRKSVTNKNPRIADGVAFRNRRFRPSVEFP